MKQDAFDLPTATTKTEEVLFTYRESWIKVPLMLFVVLPVFGILIGSIAWLSGAGRWAMCVIGLFLVVFEAVGLFFAKDIMKYGGEWWCKLTRDFFAYGLPGRDQAPRIIPVISIAEFIMDIETINSESRWNFYLKTSNQELIKLDDQCLGNFYELVGALRKASAQIRFIFTERSYDRTFGWCVDRIRNAVGELETRKEV